MRLMYIFRMMKVENRAMIFHYIIEDRYNGFQILSGDWRLK